MFDLSNRARKQAIGELTNFGNVVGQLLVIVGNHALSLLIVKNCKNRSVAPYDHQGRVDNELRAYSEVSPLDMACNP